MNVKELFLLLLEEIERGNADKEICLVIKDVRRHQHNAMKNIEVFQNQLGEISIMAEGE